MSIQTLMLGKRKFVVIPERDFLRLQRDAQARGAHSTSHGNENANEEDQRDAAILRRRLSEMRRRNEKPIPYAQARKKLGLQ